MKRIATTFALCSLLVTASAFGQTIPPPTTPPPTTPPPTTQTPPPTTPPPTTQTPPTQQAAPPQLPTAPKPAPVPFPMDAKYAFINMQIIVSESSLGKAGSKQMQALQDKKNTELQAKNKDIQALQDKMRQQQTVVSDAVMASMTKDLTKLQQEAQFMQQQAQTEVDGLNQELLTSFQEKVLPIIEAMAREKGLWVVWSVQDSGVAYVYPGLDLSMEVVKRLDATIK
jgi:outer membrane protein